MTVTEWLQFGCVIDVAMTNCVVAIWLFRAVTCCITCAWQCDVINPALQHTVIEWYTVAWYWLCVCVVGEGWDDEMRVLIGWCASCSLLMAVILAARVAHDSQQKAVYKQLPFSFPMQPTADIYVRWCCAQPIAKHALIRNYRTVNPVMSRSVRDLRE